MRRTIDTGKTCEHCGSTLIHPTEVRFCDLCKRQIPDNVRIEPSVFWENMSDSQRSEFCCWKCFFKWLTNLPFNKKMASFISLPHLGGSDKDFEEEYKIFLEAIHDISGEM